MLNPVEQAPGTDKPVPATLWGSVGKLRWLLPLAVLILAALPRLTSLQAFLANDETLYWEWSHDFFLALWRGDWAGTIVGPGNPSITLFWNHVLVMGAKYSWAWFNGVPATVVTSWPDFQPQASLELLVQRRWPIVLFNTLAVFLAYRLMGRLFSQRVALVAAVLLALDPFYLADSRTSRGEGLLASLLLLAMLTYLTYGVGGQRLYLLWSGVLTGLALLTKSSAIAVVAWALVVTIVITFSGLAELWPRVQTIMPKKPDIAHPHLSSWLGWLFIALATFWALWPGMWTTPLQALGYMAHFVSDVGVSGRDNYFFNRTYTDEILPLFYPAVFILRVTPLALLGLIGAGGYLWQVYRPRGDDNSADTSHRYAPLVTLLLLFVLIYGAMMTFGTLKRDWYILPIFPALDVVAAVGLVWLWQWGWGRWGNPRPARVSEATLWAISLIILLLLQAATVGPSHPYYFTYWNPLVLGHRWAAQAVRVGWDLDLGAGAYYLNSKPQAEALRVATRSTRGFAPIFRGKTIRWVPEQPWIQADYLLVRRNHLQREEIDPYLLDYVTHLKLDHVITIEGVDYLWVYEGPRAQYFAGPSTLAGKAMLLGYDLGQPSTLAAGDTITAKFYWQNQGMTSQDDFFLQLVDANDYLWSEAVAYPLPGFEQAALANKQIVESRVDLVIPPGTPPGVYFLRGGVFNRGRQETLGYFTLAAGGDKVTVHRADHPAVVTQLSLAYPLNAQLTPGLTLLGFDLPSEVLLLSRPTWLTLYWQADSAPGQDYAVALQLLQPDGREVHYWLGRPVFSGYPTTQWTAGELVRDPWRLELPAQVVPGQYTLQLSLFEAQTQTKVARTVVGSVSVAKRRQQFTVPTMPTPMNVTLGDQIKLLGYDLSTEPLTGGGRLRLTLYWQAVKTASASYTAFVHLMAPNGQLVAQHDGEPAEGEIPTSDWAVGEVITDRHLVEFASLPAGEYRLEVGMYDTATGQRLSVSSGHTAIPLQSIAME